MTKKFKWAGLIALTLALVLISAACSGDSGNAGGGTGTAADGESPVTNSATPTQTPSAPQNGQTPSDKDNSSGGGNSSGIGGDLFDWMKSAQYSYEYTQYDDDDESGRIVEGTLVVDGENICTIVQVTINGETQDKVRTLILDGTTYMIIDSQKMYANMGNLGSALTESGAAFAPDNLVKLGEGEEEIDGKVLRYESYEQETVGIVSILKIFYDGNKVYGYVNEGEIEMPDILGGGTKPYKSTTLIRNAKNSVDKSVFDIPDDYIDGGSLTAN